MFNPDLHSQETTSDMALLDRPLGPLRIKVIKGTVGSCGIPSSEGRALLFHEPVYPELEDAPHEEPVLDASSSSSCSTGSLPEKLEEVLLLEEFWYPWVLEYSNSVLWDDFRGGVD